MPECHTKNFFTLLFPKSMVNWLNSGEAIDQLRVSTEEFNYP